MQNFNFYEFFAGAGMARAGLGSRWKCVFANDFDGKKGLSYQENWGTGGELSICDIRNLKISQMPDTADLSWGSFPCQDLSLAGGGAGLAGERSGTFFPFWNIMNRLVEDGRGPRLIALENVCGTLTSHGGKDFGAICSAFADARYRFGALVIDAALFVPQSRPRLFFVGVRQDQMIDERLIAHGPSSSFHPTALRNAWGSLSEETKLNWVWWNLPTPPHRKTAFADVIEHRPKDVEWHLRTQTEKLLAQMTPLHIAKVEAAKRAGRLMVGGVYKRTRPNADGTRSVKAEVRFDDVAGCLRTPNGGSSRQTILLVEGENIRSRLISSRETARLMGLEDSYRLPRRYNEAYHLMGDGVAVPVVSFLSEFLFEPIILQQDAPDILAHSRNEKKVQAVGG